MYCWSESQDSLRDTQKCAEQLQWIDKCDYPNCNPTCPKIRDDFNEKILNPLEYFEKLDVVKLDSLAQELKIDKKTLLNPEYYNEIMHRIINFKRKRN